MPKLQSFSDLFDVRINEIPHFKRVGIYSYRISLILFFLGIFILIKFT